MVSLKLKPTEPTVTITLRVSPKLKADIDRARHKAQAPSLNQFIIDLLRKEAQCSPDLLSSVK